MKQLLVTKPVLGGLIGAGSTLGEGLYKKINYF
jgi:hypothetical protein